MFNKPTIISLLFLIILVESCNSRQEDFFKLPIVTIDPDKAQTYYLEDLATNISCHNLQLPENHFFGEIIDILPCGDSLLLFHDFYNKQIHIFNNEGYFTNVLNKAGRGPEEYINIEAFTANSQEHTLIIYDNGGQKLISYTLPDLKYLNHQRLSKSLISLAFLNKKQLFTISDEAKSSKAKHCDGAEIYHLIKRKFSACDIPNAYATINLSYPRTLSYTDHNLYYVCPYFYSIVYKITAQEQTPVLCFHFGKKNLPEELWKSNDALTFENMVENNQYALMPQYFLKQDSLCSFFFFNGDTEHLYMAITAMHNHAQPEVIKQINLKGINTPGGLKPLGIFQNKYICLLYPHECDFDEEEIQYSPLSQQVREKLDHSADEGTPVLLMFQPQFPAKK